MLIENSRNNKENYETSSVQKPNQEYRLVSPSYYNHWLVEICTRIDSARE